MATTHYIWDDLSDNVLMESDEVGAATAEYTHVPEQYGELVSQHRDGVTSQYHFDGLGSTRQLTDENENVTDEYTYSAFGEEVASSGTTINPFGFQGSVGYHANPSTEDLYVRARYYRPSIGRWISEDPLEFTDSPNSYSYVINNPIDYADPSGLSVLVFGWEGFGAKPPKFIPKTSHTVITDIYVPLGKAAVRYSTFDVRGQKALNLAAVGLQAREIVKAAKTPEYFVGCIPCFPRIVLVGYSWGGNTAAKVASAMSVIDKTVAIDAVFTIDPILGNVFNSALSKVVPKPNVCRWDSYYQTTSSVFRGGTGFRGDRFDIATNTRFTKQDFANGPYLGLGQVPANPHFKGHILIPYLKPVQSDFSSMMREFDLTLGAGREDWAMCGVSDVCLY